MEIPTLRVYLLIEQEIAAVTCYRRVDEGFDAEVYQGLDAVVTLDEIGIELPLAELYERAELTPELGEGNA